MNGFREAEHLTRSTVHCQHSTNSIKDHAFCAHGNASKPSIQVHASVFHNGCICHLIARCNLTHLFDVPPRASIYLFDKFLSQRPLTANTNSTALFPIIELRSNATFTLLRWDYRWELSTFEQLKISIHRTGTVEKFHFSFGNSKKNSL